MAGPLLVLVEPQDIVNIASAVRIAKNFDLEGIRLVRPAVFDPYRIEGIAHNTADLVSRIELHDSLESALADCVYSVALTARSRTAKRSLLSPREAAPGLMARRPEGPVAIVAGREDKGLTNAELDQCRLLVTIPTSPGYRSLNLAQAVALVAYETWLVRAGEAPARTGPADPASSEQLEWLFTDWTKALWAIDFFKTRQPELVMRGLREILFRADLDRREAALVRAMGIEVVRYLARHGVPAGAGSGPAGEQEASGDTGPP